MAILQDRRSLNLRDPALAYLANWGEPSVFASGVRDNELGGLGLGVERHCQNERRFRDDLVQLQQS